MIEALQPTPTTDALAPVALAAAGAALALALWRAARATIQWALLMRFLAAVAAAWAVLCAVYVAARPTEGFVAYLTTSGLATAALAATGGVLYLGAFIRFEPGERKWRRSSALLAGVTLMVSAFFRASYQPSLALYIQVPVAVVLVGTMWRFLAEPLVYLAVLLVAVTVVATATAVRDAYAPESPTPDVTWATSVASAVSLVMVAAAAGLAFVRRPSLNVKWYRQGLLIVPLLVSSLSATGAGYAAVWHGATWHTVWAVSVLWVVLLVSAVGLGQADLFGFSSVAAGCAAAAAFAVLGGDAVEGYWGRYPAVLLVIAYGAVLIAALVALGPRRGVRPAFGRALYLAGAAIAAAALVIEPFETTARFLGIDLLLAAGILLFAHFHRAPAWTNYLFAALVTAGLATVTRPGPEAAPAVWHHRFMLVTAAIGLGWLGLALGVRQLLRATASDRTARRQVEPLVIFGMVTIVFLAGYLTVQEVRAYGELLIAGTSPTLPLVGPGLGLGAWLAVLAGFLASQWLFRHTARTFLFYCFGISATAYLGLVGPAADLYEFLIYAVAGYGSAHLLVYLYEARFMGLLSRVSALYREERRASTTIFTLAVISCFIGALLAAFRLDATASLIMLGVMSAVFLVWSFVWLRGEMLYAAVVMVTLGVLALWHNKVQPQAWDPQRVGVNAAVCAFSALFWMGVGNRLHAIRGEVFQLAEPARSSSVILGLLAAGFAAALAMSPLFPSAVWREPRALGDWALGVTTYGALVGYFAWARSIYKRRFFSFMGGAVILLFGLYLGYGAFHAS